MIFDKHFSLDGSHAFLSASKYSWLNYEEEDLEKAFLRDQAARKGTRLHKLAHDLITEGIKVRDMPRTFNMYVNDAISYRMTSEQLLFVSENCFGTPDAISFSEKKMKLRISDLKTGAGPTSEKQLLIYAAMFCMEYGRPEKLDFRPMDISAELRIYQNDECRIYDVDMADVIYITQKIIAFDRWLTQRRAEEAR